MNEFEIVGTIELVMPLEETASGVKVLNFTVRYDRPGEKSRKKDDLFRITTFRDLAEEAVRYRPGEKVIVKGRMQDNNYSRDEKTYYTVELIADNVYKTL